MRDNVLNRLEAEATAYRDHLVSGDFTAEQIVEQSYQFVMKQSIYYVFANHNSNKLSCDEWNWLNQQEHILDYLYELWMHNDMDLSEEFAEMLHNEINLDMEEHANE